MNVPHLAGIPICVPVLLGLLTAVVGCAPTISRYTLVEQSLGSGDFAGADRVIEEAEEEYGAINRVLYDMDRGMTLHLAGHYQASTLLLEEADAKVEDLYTRRISAEVKAFLINDTRLPFGGEPFEQVLLNVLKALNYALLREWDEALVEARRLDHRLNVLADRVEDKTKYRDDPFARYLSGILYELTGDLNNAFIAYRNAFEGYQSAQAWSHIPVPPMLTADLLRVTAALHLSQEHDLYKREFGEVAWQPWEELTDLAHVIVISYNGRAPRKEDLFIDLPISLEALNLVLLTKLATSSENTAERRAVESLLYGFSGRVVRVALPKLIQQKTQVTHSRVSLSGTQGSAEATTEPAHNVGAAAKKALEDRFAAIAVKAVARAASKFALAEGAQRGAEKTAGKDTGPLIGLLVGIIGKSLAVATEESDKRSWRTLPDEIQIARLWVPPGDYDLRVQAVTNAGNATVKDSVRRLTLRSGETRIVVERVLR